MSEDPRGGSGVRDRRDGPARRPAPPPMPLARLTRSGKPDASDVWTHDRASAHPHGYGMGSDHWPDQALPPEVPPARPGMGRLSDTSLDHILPGCHPERTQ
ncbi:hypothetical protein FRAHR75_560016 [Frankia sp. Hr75.2]|nr:hypothetical protein FRAHR75_560016 [Frankia sp. Hr75.2]SQD99282.1 hypothetical protein FMEAI12_5170031 [Parafrankia sp. Ea1.12]